jgi:hypothetical protein
MPPLVHVDSSSACCQFCDIDVVVLFTAAVSVVFVRVHQHSGAAYYAI